MPPLRFLSPVFALFLLTCCSGERSAAPVAPGSGRVGETPPPSERHGPVAEARGKETFRIEPAEVYRGTPVRVSSDAVPPSDAAVEWLVNGEIVRGGGGPTLDTGQLRKGDMIQARAVGARGTVLSQVVTVRNSLPEMRGVRFVLGDGGPGSSLGVEADASDADGDAVRIEIEWQKNGEPAGAGNRLGVPVRKGDKIRVTLTPFDGEERGKSASLSREIRNTNPMIEGQDQFQVSGNVVTFRVRASDADGDSLAYSIKDAPAGMRIDRTSGEVRWETAPGTTGKVPFAVTVSDGSGGEVTARFTVTISEQSPSGTR